MLVQRDQLAERFGSQLVGENHARGTIALEHAMRRQPIRRAFGLDLLKRFPECERLGLREYVREQQIVMASERIERPAETDEVARDQFRPLVDELVERMLAVGAGLAPVNRSRLIIDGRAFERDVLAVGFHRQLLEIGGKALEVLLVRQYRDGLRTEEIVVPDSEQAH